MKLTIRKRVISCLSAAALLVYTLLPFFAVYQLPAQIDAAKSASPFGGKVLLCTAEGFRLVSWADLASGKEKPKPHQEYRCPLCYVAAHGQLLKPPSSLYATEWGLTIFAQAYFYPNPAAATERSWRQFLTRSPPSSFIA